MNCLLIETSTEKGGVALYKGSDCLFKVYFPEGLQSSQHLLPVLKDELEKIAFDLKDLSLIAVGIGPGSYTGIRVGAMAAKTLSYALQKPLLGITTLKWFIPQKEGPFIVMLDAKIGGVYCLKGVKGGHTIEYTATPVLCPWEELAEYCQDETWSIVSANLKHLREKVNGRIGHNHLEWEEACPNFAHVINLVQQDTDYKIPENARLDLLYLRETQAEIEKKRLIEGEIGKCQ